MRAVTRRASGTSESPRSLTRRSKRAPTRSSASPARHDLADLLIAPWPAAFGGLSVGLPDHARVVHTGALSRWDDRPRGERPDDDGAFGEQLRTAVALHHANLAVVTLRPDEDDLAEFVERARALGGERWSEWSDGKGARRAADVVRGLATRRTEEASCARWS